MTKYDRTLGLVAKLLSESNLGGLTVTLDTSLEVMSWMALHLEIL
jgi:hypothetical protein